MFDPRGCLTALRNEAAVWSRGKNWAIRFPLFFFFLYILIRHLFAPDYSSILQALNLGIHECGHFLFMFFGQFLNVLGGTLAEIAAPFAGMWNFYLQKDFFAVALCFGWLSTALFDVARYAGDARAMVIPLVAPFGGGDGGVNHDWNYLLGQVGLLDFDQSVAFLFRSLAVIAMLIALSGSSWLLWQMMLGDEV